MTAKLSSYILTCWLALITVIVAPAQRSIFINYSIEDGIPQSSVMSIYQDIDGSIWFGTQGGVCKYNGNSFTTFDTRHGIGGNHVISILQDSKRRYWFGHRYKGVTVKTGKNFKTIDITDQQINIIKEDVAGNIWLGTHGKGVYVLPAGMEPEKENFIPFSSKLDLPLLFIYSIYISIDDNIWIASREGLCRIVNYGDSVNSQVKFITKENSKLPFTTILYIEPENDTTLWFLGYEGLAKIYTGDFPLFENSKFFKFDKNVNVFSSNNIVFDSEGVIWGTGENCFFKFKNDSFNFFFSGKELFYNKTNIVYRDNENNIWIGTMNNGVFKYSGDKFTIIDDWSGLTDNVVKYLIEDSKGNIWISAKEGISIFDGKTFRYLSVKDDLFNNAVDVIFEDSRGNIWLGDYLGNALLRYNPDKKSFRQFTVKDGLINNSVLAINEDKHGNIWFATLHTGVSRYTYPDRNKPEKIATYTVDDGLCSNDFWTIHRDNKANLWFGSDNAGITKYDGHNFITYNDKDGLTNLSAGAITHDSKNNLWIATIGGGIFKFDGSKFINYSIIDGLSSDNPYSIICDNNDNVWIGTNTGIDKFDPVTETFKHYGKSDGFIGIENNQNSVFKSHDGILWFGTMNGVVRFDPSKDKPNTIPPKLVIDNIRLFYNDFDYNKYSGSINIKTSLPKNLILPYNKNHLTFDYVGISLTSPDKVRYQYMLENFDPAWNPITDAITATYTNIPPGVYSFKIKARNNDGYWNKEPYIFSFTIKPPVWGTLWFRIIAAFLIISIIYFLYLLRIKNIKSQKEKLQLQVDDKTRQLITEALERKKAQEKAEQADRLKSAFLANMSHEIRTPVNSIIGFADLLKDQKLNKKDQSTFLNYVISGGKTLLTLIDDIIDISKIEAGQIRISKEDCNLYSLMSELFMSFYETKNKKGKDNVELIMENKPDDKNFFIKSDPYRIKQILSNLLGNAIKFTDTGYIKFGYHLEKHGNLIFFVKDTGLGIPEDKQEIIFHRFRQVEETFTRNKEGTGLGLAISKKLSELLGGQMWVKSVPNKGSSFYFSIPYELVKSEKQAEILQPVSALEISWEGKNILVVEDEDSNFLLMENILKKQKVNVHRASNGNSAVEFIENNSIETDLILMDIKIPGLNGYEATRKIKEINSKIPIIAQTAYAMSGEKEKCLAAGCDDYISKPIDRKKLFAVVSKYLDSKS